MPKQARPPSHDGSNPDLFDRARLIQRWQHGSESFFYRHERSGRLTTVTDGTKVRYRREDIYAFEGGQPPDGMEAAYAEDLLTEVQVAQLCSVAWTYVLTAARRAELPARRIGSAYRFVPAEVESWQKRRFVNRKTLNPSQKSSDE